MKCQSGRYHKFTFFYPKRFILKVPLAKHKVLGSMDILVSLLPHPCLHAEQQDIQHVSNIKAYSDYIAHPLLHSTAHAFVHIQPRHHYHDCVCQSKSFSSGLLVGTVIPFCRWRTTLQEGLGRFLQLGSILVLIHKNIHNTFPGLSHFFLKGIYYTPPGFALKEIFCYLISINQVTYSLSSNIIFNFF